MNIFLLISFVFIFNRRILQTTDLTRTSKNDCQENDLKLLNYFKYSSNQSSFKLNRTIFANFDRFSELNTLTKSDITCNFTLYNVTNFLTFIPKRSLIVDETFCLENILTQSQINTISYLQFINIKGIDVALMPIHFNLPKRFKKYIQMEIYSSHFDTYSTGVNAECSIGVYLNRSATNLKLNFLNSFNSVSFVNTVYPKGWCTLAFANSKIDNLVFADVTNSYLKQNRLKFEEANDTYSDKLRVIKSYIMCVNFCILFTHRAISKLFWVVYIF
jgi:hypothetical protein